MPITIPADIANRIFYRDGQFLTADTMQIEADYFTSWITWQNRSLYNPGWLLGLDVAIGDGNTLIVEPGTGIDAQGHFLILPGTGNVTYPVQAPSTPCYLILRYPTSSKAAARMASQPVNMAATLQIVTDPAPPADAILLAEIGLNDGVVVKVTDRRAAVTSRVHANVPPAEAGAASAAATIARQGTIDVPVGKLRAVGDHVDLPVFYVGSGVPAFAAPPRVVASVQGPLPFAVNVDKVDTIGFVLGVTVVISTAEPPDRLVVDWIASKR